MNFDEFFVVGVGEVLVFEDFVEVRRDYGQKLIERPAISDVFFGGFLVLAEREPAPERGALVLVVLSALGDVGHQLDLPTEVAVNYLRVRERCPDVGVLRDNLLLSQSRRHVVVLSCIR